MFTQVVLGIDREGRAVELVGPALAIAPQAKCRLVHVVSRRSGATTKSAEPGAFRRGQRLLQRERASVDLPGVEIEVIADRSAAFGLARAAASADLLVLGTPGPRPATERPGEVTRNIFHQSQCPLLLVPAGSRDVGDRPHVLGVAFDGSTESFRALDVAVAIARQTGAVVQLCRALDTSTIDDRLGAAVDEFVASVMATEHERLAEVVAGIEVPCHVEVVAGSAADTLGALARRCDVVVCGSHGWAPAARTAFGSTADDLVASIRTPLLVVPRELPHPLRAMREQDRHGSLRH